MSLPTRTNTGLGCNSIKKKQLLQYALENLQNDLNFTRKGNSSQISFRSIPQICVRCLFSGSSQTVTGFKQSVNYKMSKKYNVVYRYQFGLINFCKAKVEKKLGVWNPGLWRQSPLEKVSYLNSESILNTLECSLGSQLQAKRLSKSILMYKAQRRLS